MVSMEETPFETLPIREASTLVVMGCVDEDKVDQLRNTLNLVCADGSGQDVIVDLTQVEFLPSLAIGVLIGAMKRCAAAGRGMQLIAPEGTIARRVLDLCVLPVAESRQPSIARTADRPPAGASPVSTAAAT
jgi:anti-anti-sigma factor